jgi:hypothetical protein
MRVDKQEKKSSGNDFVFVVEQEEKRQRIRARRRCWAQPRFLVCSVPPFNTTKE